MNASLKRTLFVSLTAFALLGAATAARAADDMGGMKMGDSKAAAEKKPDKEMGKEPAKKGSEKLEIAITDKGFEPDKLEVRKGQPVELVFTRKTDQTCIKEVILDTGAKKIQKPLPLNKPVTIKTKFTKAGDLKYACNMNMFSGTVTVQ
jgi:plastocyanin domain-containing protein